MLDKLLAAIESHYAENVLIVLFWTMVGLMVYCNHTHNDEMGRWATTVAGNDLSALFGMLVGKKVGQ